MNLKNETKITLRRTFKKYVTQKCFRKAITFASRNKLKGVLSTKRTVEEKYGLSKLDISKLQFIEVENPHYKCMAPMRLYLIAQAEYFSAKNKQQSKNKRASNS